jgi:TolB-like protein
MSTLLFSRVFRARDVFRFGVLATVGACAGGGALRIGDVTPQSIPSLEAENNQRPNDPGVLTRLGVAYFKADRYQDARPALDSAVARDPRSGIAAIYLGMTTEALGDFPAARAAYERYLSVARSRELRSTARQRLALIGRRELEFQAREALASEATLLQTPPTPNTVAVMPFSYSGTDPQIQPLGRGLAQLVITDLAKSRQVIVLERERMQSMLDEMRLSDQNRVEQQTAVRSGRLLRAERVVQGTIAERGDQLRVDAAVVDVSTAGVAATGNASDLLTRLFDLEKALVFTIFNNLGIQLTDAERAAIDQRPTQNIQAFLAFSRGLEAEDRGDFQAAREAYTQAAALDPSFQAAAQGAATATDLSTASTQSVSDVDVTVTQNAQQEAAGPAAPPTDALTNAANAVAGTQTSDQASQQQTPTAPPANRNNTSEVTGGSVRPTTGTVVIVIRRPT